MRLFPFEPAAIHAKATHDRPNWTVRNHNSMCKMVGEPKTIIFRESNLSYVLYKECEKGKVKIHNLDRCFSARSVSFFVSQFGVAPVTFQTKVTIRAKCCFEETRIPLERQCQRD